MSVDAEKLVNALGDVMVAELKAVRERLAEAEQEIARLRGVSL